MADIPKAEKPRTKAQMVKDIAAATELPPKDVGKVLDALQEVILHDLAPSRGRAKRAGSVTVAGLVKIDVVEQKATKKRMGRNPATGEEIEIAAKPYKKRGKVRVRALKTLKDVL